MKSGGLLLFSPTDWRLSGSNSKDKSGEAHLWKYHKQELQAAGLNCSLLTAPCSCWQTCGWHLSEAFCHYDGVLTLPKFFLLDSKWHVQVCESYTHHLEGHWEKGMPRHGGNLPGHFHLHFMFLLLFPPAFELCWEHRSLSCKLRVYFGSCHLHVFIRLYLGFG